MQIQFTVGNAKVWFAYYGIDPATNQQAHADASGNIVANVPSTKPTAALANPAPSGPITFPMLIAARLYVSIGAPVMFPVDPAGIPIPPSAADPADTNYQTRWDFFELTYLPLTGTDGLFNFNLSNVQSANLPLSFEVGGADPGTKQPVKYSRGWLPGGYTKFLSYLGANADFRPLILSGTERVLAPGTAITAFEQKVIPVPLMNGSYWKAYVEAVWAKFAGVDLTFVGDPPPQSNTFVTWTGRVGSGQYPLNAVIQTGDHPPQPFPTGVGISDIYQQSGKALLILGAPGCGKTTALLDLLEHLLDEAGDSIAPIPVLVNLASWAEKRKTIPQWLAEEMRDRSYSAKAAAEELVASEQFVALLDGLDEVAECHRAACVAAINRFQRDHPMVSLVVSSRVHDYAALSVKLRLLNAVIVKPLERSQVQSCLQQIGPAADRLRGELELNPVLWELVKTPLMLWVALLGYSGEGGRSLEIERAEGETAVSDRLFARFTETMLSRRAPQSHYSKTQTESWLVSLAARLRRKEQILFTLEQLEYSSLCRRGQRCLARALTVLSATTLGILLELGLLLAWRTVHRSPLAGMVDEPFFGYIDFWGMFTDGLLLGTIALFPFSAVESVRFISTGFRSRAWRAIKSATLIWAVVVLVVLWSSSISFTGDAGISTIAIGLADGGLLGGYIAILVGFAGLFLVESANSRTVPGQGIRRSSWVAIAVLLGIYAVFLTLRNEWFFRLPVFMSGLTGGFFVLRNTSIRLTLFLYREAPLRYMRFLNFAHERLFLHRVGGGYQYTHRLLLEHLADRAGPKSHSVVTKPVVFPDRPGGIATSWRSAGRLCAGVCAFVAAILCLSDPHRMWVRTVQLVNETVTQERLLLAAYPGLDVPQINRADDRPPAVIDNAFPDDVRIAIVNQWGSGSWRAALLMEHLASKSPDILIHLGGILYSGTRSDIRKNFLDPLARHLDLKRTRVFSLAADYELVNRGGYQELMQKLGQPAANFVLRGRYWQFVAVDNSAFSEFNFYSFQEWAENTLRSKPGTHSILLSHEGESLLTGKRRMLGRAVSTTEHMTIYSGAGYSAAELERMFASGSLIKANGTEPVPWFFGGHHEVMLYRHRWEVAGELVPRCIGNGGMLIPNDIEVMTPADAFPIRSGKGPFFMNLNYAIITLNGPVGKVEYYDVDPDTARDNMLYVEQLPMLSESSGPVKAPLH